MEAWEEKEQLHCPKCAGPMERISIAGQQVDRCAQCGGLWFDMLEADKLRKADQAEAVDTAPVRKEMNAQAAIYCPRDKAQMLRMVDLEQHHIWYEKCPVCYGVFFDAGEFRDLQEQSLSDFFKGLFTGERK